MRGGGRTVIDLPRGVLEGNLGCGQRNVQARWAVSLFFHLKSPDVLVPVLLQEGLKGIGSHL